MIRRHGNAIRSGVMLFDGAAAVVLSMLLYQIFAHPNVSTADFVSVFGARAALYALLWVGLLYINGAYRLRAHWTIIGEIIPVVRATLALALLGSAILVLAAMDITGGGWVLVLFPLQGLLAIALRTGLRVAFMFVRRSGHNLRNLLVVGTGPDAVAFGRLVDEQSVLGVKVIGYLGEQPPVATSAVHLGSFDDLPRVLQDHVVDEVALCVSQAAWSDVEALAQLAHEEGKLVRVPLAVPELRSSERFVEDVDGVAVMSFTSGPDELTSLAMKRMLDVALGVTGLVLALPVLLAIGLAMRLSQGPGILFRQERVGLHGRPFTIYKLRTMVVDAEERFTELAAQSYTEGPAFKLPDDPRVTPVGRWLRRFSLDELPQLWNVIRGQMSVVGPRPAPLREVQAYDLWHRRRLSVKPGITGLWQINSRLDADFDRRAELDMAYIDGWSIWLDLSILLRTVPAVIRRPGH